MNKKIMEHKIVKTLAIIVLVSGLLVAFGWFFDIDVLKSVLPDAPTMKFGTSISFVCAGVVFFFIARMREGKASLTQIVLPTSALIIIMFLTVNTVSVLLGGSISITSLFPERQISTEPALTTSRPSIGTLISFTLIAAAAILSLSDFARARKLLVGIGAIVGTIGTIALLGYATNQPTLYFDFEETSSALAFHTAILFTMSGAALILLGNDKKKDPPNMESFQIKTKVISLFMIISIVPIVFLALIIFLLIRDFEILGSFGYSFTIISIVAISAAAMFAYIITRQIVKPITHLKDTAIAISNGNLNTKATENTTDEIGQLAKTFNSMVDGIKKTAELQIETERLRQIDKDKEEFAAMVSHELKTPLIPISGYAELFLDGSLGTMTEVQREKMHVIYDNSIRLTGLIQDILDARKIELGRLKLDMHDETIKEIVKRSMDIFGPIAEQKHVRLVDQTDDIIVRCDPDRILQVLNNVISNSIKFTPAQDGTISINSRAENGLVVVSIKDNGAGIPKEKQDDLFKKFYQVDKTLTRKSGGTGLGLAISRGIIESHGGKIWVESGEGRGTTVYFTIPRGDIT